jgi:hypothetical protein
VHIASQQSVIEEMIAQGDSFKQQLKEVERVRMDKYYA